MSKSKTKAKSPSLDTKKRFLDELHIDELIDIGRKNPNFETSYGFFVVIAFLFKFLAIPALTIYLIYCVVNLIIDRKYIPLIFGFDHKKYNEMKAHYDNNYYWDHSEREYNIPDYDNTIYNIIGFILSIIGIIILLLLYRYSSKKIEKLHRSSDDLSVKSAIRIGKKVKSARKRAEIRAAAYQGARMGARRRHGYYY